MQNEENAIRDLLRDEDSENNSTVQMGRVTENTLERIENLAKEPNLVPVRYVYNVDILIFIG
jgi:hypothetical protein